MFSSHVSIISLAEAGVMAVSAGVWGSESQSGQATFKTKFLVVW